MKRRIFSVAIIALLAGVFVTLPGCDSDIDWKALSKKAITEFIGQQMIIAFTQFDDNELQIKHWVTGKITTAKWLDPYLDDVGDAFVSAAVDKVYDLINDKWYDLLKAKGYDVDGDDFGNAAYMIYDVSTDDFPELFEDEFIDSI